MKLHVSDKFKLNNYDNMDSLKTDCIGIRNNLNKIWLMSNGMYKYIISINNNESINDWIKRYYVNSIIYSNKTNLYEILNNTKDNTRDYTVFIIDRNLSNQIKNEDISEINTIENVYYMGTLLNTDIKLNLLHLIFIFKHSETIPSILYDPPLYVKTIKHNNINLNIVRDDVVIGGTKSRAVMPYIQQLLLDSPNISELIYLGASNGYAQVAFANTLRLLKSDIKLTIYFQSTKIKDAYKIQCLAKRLYKIKYISLAKPMREIWPLVDKQLAIFPNSYLIEFGLRDNKYESLLFESLSHHLENFVDKIKVMWLVIGSGAIFAALYKILPYTFFNIVQVGKAAKLELFDNTRYKLHISSYKLYQSVDVTIPYSTTSSYDGKVWEFSELFTPDDWIWNTAGIHDKI